MRILISPGPFKESLSADEASAAIARGVKLALPNASITLLPMCDGGTGFSERITSHAKGRVVSSVARDPLGRNIDATYGIIDYNGGKAAVIESASTAGLALLSPTERNPSITSTIGIGDLIKHAVLTMSCNTVFIGCGDSATNDGGAGMLVGLGAKLLDSKGADIPLGGGALAALAEIDLDDVSPKIFQANFRVACNVTSILCGSDGTSRIYSFQKGADDAMALQLSDALDQYAKIVLAMQGVDVRYIPGGGAAGGLGAALHAFLGAKLDFSMNVVREFVDLDTAIGQSDLVLTGEGCVDARTATGKVVACVALACAKHNVPVIAFAGQVGRGSYLNYFLGLDGLVAIADGPLSLKCAIENASSLLEDATFRTMRIICKSQGI